MNDVLPRLQAFEEAIRQKLLLALPHDAPPPRWQQMGLVRAYFDQATGRFAFQSVNASGSDRVSRAVPDLSHDLVTAHQLEAARPVHGRTYGSLASNGRELRLSMLGLGRIPDVRDVIWEVIQTQPHLRLESMELNTLRVLSADWNLQLTAEKNIDPSVDAWKLVYSIFGCG
ncbi:hypothetical protein [Spirosoma sordidisoli]|uniref:Uncharacterized protein n=1 Tax=Spirosoma sordidisoli TaxID=2502893 RepID=A0A4Q2UHZ0_9BACT|nr:hypothetical protein [Spirosoma sordidisoli]RYC66359.1 hypothetical protein EQG79_30260 [Spirosoma sordidisoli]